jgi:hypothetical protein
VADGQLNLQVAALGHELHVLIDLGERQIRVDFRQPNGRFAAFVNFGDEAKCVNTAARIGTKLPCLDATGRMLGRSRKVEWSSDAGPPTGANQLRISTWGRPRSPALTIHSGSQRCRIVSSFFLPSAFCEREAMRGACLQPGSASNSERPGVSGELN